MGWNYISIPKLPCGSRFVWEWMSNFIPHFSGVWILMHAGIKVAAYSYIDQQWKWCLFTYLISALQIQQCIQFVMACNVHNTKEVYFSCYLFQCLCFVRVHLLQNVAVVSSEQYESMIRLPSGFDPPRLFRVASHHHASLLHISRYLLQNASMHVSFLLNVPHLPIMYVRAL